MRDNKQRSLNKGRRTSQNGQQGNEPQTKDNILLITVLLLMGVGLVMVYSTSAIYVSSKFGGKNSFLFLEKHLIVLIPSLFSLILFSYIPYPYLRWLTYPFLTLAFTLLVLTLFSSLGVVLNNARRWLSIGPVLFQPSEFAKLALILYFSHVLSKKQEKIKSFSKTFLPGLIILGLFFGLIFKQPDLGTSINLVIIILGLFFVAGIPLRYILGLFLIAGPGLGFLIWRVPYQRERLLAFLNPWKDSMDSGYQLIQSLIALGNGGISGVGLGQGHQKLFYLPEPYADFIFATIGEELGLLGSFLILGLFGILIWRGIRIALQAPDLFGMLMAIGLTLLIGTQFLINLGVVTGLLPTKGLPLPFISYGGSSLLVCSTSVGILLSISRYSSKKVTRNAENK
ncbi:MAG TPA: putative lipid II flippase FtsW [Candidatus Limnocylindrales bacterium]|nr:putative lipid II flippase FtsW [Candidatus Limnocylindrales bacterium]